MNAKSDRPVEAGEGTLPRTVLIRTFPAGHLHLGGVVVVCPRCGHHHWLAYQRSGTYSCPYGDGQFVVGAA